MEPYTIGKYIDKLKDEGILAYSDVGNLDEIVKAITYNSKEAGNGALFVCKGLNFRKSYLDDAISKGAGFYVSEIEYHVDAPAIIVTDIRKAMYLIANIYYDNPWQDLNLIGITGTKGKSTTLYYLKSILDLYLNSQGKPTSGYTSSVDFYDGKNLTEAHNTTPEAMELQKILRASVSNGLSFFEMEVSSQALKYDRVGGMMYDYGVFMNISEDHISPIEHNSFEDYFQSKLKLFDITKTALVNLNSDHINLIMERAQRAQKIITFGRTEEADIYAYNIKKISKSCTEFMVKSNEINEKFELPMPGIFNVENALAAISIALECNIPLEYIKRGLKTARCPGRMELFSSKDDRIIAIVDYAHNKLSFEKLFESAVNEYPGYKIVAVFGSAGDKAFTRRKDLGEVAGRFADKIYLTEDDPGEESPEKIIEEIYEYAAKFGKPIEKIIERSDAIKSALDDHDVKTIYLILGKGTESNMKIGKEFVPYPSDSSVVTEYISSYNKNH